MHICGKISLLAFLAFLGIGLSTAYAQSLNDYFAQAKPAVTTAADNGAAESEADYQAARKAAPLINRDLPQLRAALQGRNIMVRNQALSLLLSALISERYGSDTVKYDAAAAACVPDILPLVHDQDPVVANAAIKVLAMMQPGPPASATETLLEALHTNFLNPDFNQREIKTYAVIGLLRSQSFNDDLAHQVASALRNAPDVSSKLALLEGIAPDQEHKSDIVAGAASVFLYDSDPDVREEAWKQVPYAYKTQSLAKVQMQNFIKSSQANAHDKAEAENILAHLNQP